ncbi:hypothetical protein R1flu_012593 [Riccia fluitans]|uniref:chitinase n=1 Tax=Riccia fluitans TaxID=41844 RepID=A0ABD1ZB23_9MARC
MGMEKNVFSVQILGYVIILLLVSAVNRTSAGQIAGYWGQDGNEGSLDSLCNSGNYGIILISFLSQFGSGQAPVLNLAGHCDPPSGTCTVFASQIKNCQNKGIKVLLSLGGASGNYGFNSADEARTLAQQIWDSYLGGNGNRPLGDARLDGIDLDLENGRSAFYADLGGRLREIAQNNKYKRVYFSAAPQCPFPDNSLGPQGGKFLSAKLADFVFVQFYNNPGCDIRGGTEGVISAWRQWTSGLPDPKPQVFMGLLASSNTGDQGFMDSGTLKNSILPRIKSIGNYGGVMLWKPASNNGRIYYNLISVGYTELATIEIQDRSLAIHFLPVTSEGLGTDFEVVVIVSFRSFPRWRLLGSIALLTSAIRGLLDRADQPLKLLTVVAWLKTCKLGVHEPADSVVMSSSWNRLTF